MEFSGISIGLKLPGPVVKPVVKPRPLKLQVIAGTKQFLPPGGKCALLNEEH